MRQIVIKYQGNCKKCNVIIEVGKDAMYEKSMGIFCIGHEPKDTEEIRKYRQEKADKKIEKLNQWAEKREKQAHATLDYNFEHYTSDIAFNTQPGHIPIRSRVIKQDERACESLETAERMRARAKLLGHVQVKGDAEKDRQIERDKNDRIAKKGMRIESFFGSGIIQKINKKTYTIKFDKFGSIFPIDKTYVSKFIQEEIK